MGKGTTTVIVYDPMTFEVISLKIYVFTKLESYPRGTYIHYPKKFKLTEK